MASSRTAWRKSSLDMFVSGGTCFVFGDTIRHSKLRLGGAPPCSRRGDLSRPALVKAMLRVGPEVWSGLRRPERRTSRDDLRHRTRASGVRLCRRCFGTHWRDPNIGSTVYWNRGIRSNETPRTRQPWQFKDHRGFLVRRSLTLPLAPHWAAGVFDDFPCTHKRRDTGEVLVRKCLTYPSAGSKKN